MRFAAARQSFLFAVISTSFGSLLEQEVTITSMSKSVNKMQILAVRKAQVAHPTGDPKFSVMQPFPAAFSAEESDPFLMCDSFGPTLSKGVETDPDKFQVGWHPHRGMDILTYLIEGVGRHADSLGNRESFASPGMQWISVGSGIEHAEGGGTPAGERMHGFQIWVNVPSELKMAEPRYGTEPPENIPVVSFGAGTAPEEGFARVLAGTYSARTGPFKTVQPVQVLDITLAPQQEITHELPEILSNCLIYPYKGAIDIGDATVKAHECVRLNAGDTSARQFTITAGPEGASFMLFAGQMLHQPIAWHGPFVMTTEAEIKQTIKEYQTGTFLRKRAAWDYKRIATKPKSNP